MGIKKKMPPRKVPSRDEKYMGLAHWMASFSKDPNTQMGAVIVTGDNHPLGWGYNGPPRSIKDMDIDWSRPEKYDYIIHAEENAIDHCMRTPSGATLYVTGFPCKKCMLKIVQYNIRKVVWFPYESQDGSSMFNDPEQKEISESIAIKATPIVTIAKFDGNLNWMRDRMMVMETLGVFN